MKQSNKDSALCAGTTDELCYDCKRYTPNRGKSDNQWWVLPVIKDGECDLYVSPIESDDDDLDDILDDERMDADDLEAYHHGLRR